MSNRTELVATAAPLLPLRAIPWTPELLIRVARTLAGPRSGESAQPRAFRLRGLSGDPHTLATAFRVLADMIETGTHLSATGGPLPEAFQHAMPEPGTPAFWQLVWYGCAVRTDDALLELWEPVLARLVAALVPDASRDGRQRVAIDGMDASALRGVFDAVIGRGAAAQTNGAAVDTLLLRLAPAVHIDSGGTVFHLIDHSTDRTAALFTALSVTTIAEAIALLAPRARRGRLMRGPDWIAGHGGWLVLYWYTKHPDTPTEWVHGLADALMPALLTTSYLGTTVLEAILLSPSCPFDRILPVLEHFRDDRSHRSRDSMLERFAMCVPTPLGVWPAILRVFSSDTEFLQKLTHRWYWWRHARGSATYSTTLCAEDLEALDALFADHAAPEHAAVWAQSRAASSDAQ